MIYGTFLACLSMFCVLHPIMYMYMCMYTYMYMYMYTMPHSSNYFNILHGYYMYEFQSVPGCRYNSRAGTKQGQVQLHHNNSAHVYTLHPWTGSFNPNKHEICT